MERETERSWENEDYAGRSEGKEEGWGHVPDLLCQYDLEVGIEETIKLQLKLD